VGVAKVNNFLEMGFWQRMGAGSEGKKFWRRKFGEGRVLAEKEKKFFGEGISTKDGC